MIKLLAIIKRKQGMTLEAFSKYWYEKHAQLGLKVIPQSVKWNVYIQNHAIILPKGGEPPYDGAAESYFDNLESLTKWNKWYFSDEAKILRDDEENFMERNKTIVMVTEERLIEGSRTSK